jgi:SAM-dependent methyltransferase
MGEGVPAPLVTNSLLATAEEVLRSVGIETGRTCLDFGCGHGNYTIPLARLVGPEGDVYALDKDRTKLDRLVERAHDAGLDNITRIDSAGGPGIPLDDASVDVILLYDVVHSHYFSAVQRDGLFLEIGRVAADPALLSVFPNHMERGEIEEQVVQRAAGVGFRPVREYRGPVVHDDGVTEGRVITFSKGWSHR